MALFRYKINDGDWVDVDAPLPYTIPANSWDDVAVEPIIDGTPDASAYRATLDGTGYDNVPEAPVNTVLPTQSGTYTEGQTLTATTGTWTGAAPITYAYQWQRDGVNISGATSATYVQTGDDVGAVLTCEVTATNAAGSAMAETVNATETAAAPATEYNAIWLGQSEMARLLTSAHVDLANAPAVDADGILRIFFYEDDGTQKDVTITNAARHSRAAAELANYLNAAAPGISFNIAVAAKGGTGLYQSLDDAQAGRSWADDAGAINAMATATSATPDAVLMSWQNADSLYLFDQIGDAWWAALTETSLLDGSTVTAGSTLYSMDFDHFWSDLWDTDTVPFAFLMHRYDVLNTGAVDRDRWQRARIGMDRLVNNPRNTARTLPFTRGIDPIIYDCPTGDEAHPEKSDFGTERFVKYLGYNMLRQLGLGTTINPEPQVVWNLGEVCLHAGAYDLTTYRILNSEALPSGQPKVAPLLFAAAEAPNTWVEVPDAAIEFRDGRIYIDATLALTAASSARTQFAPGDSLDPSGAGPAGALNATDVSEDAWKDYPGVEDPAGLLDLIPPRPAGISYCDLPVAAVPTNLWTGDLSADAGATAQGDGYWFTTKTKVGDTSGGDLNLTSAMTEITICMDIDRIEGRNAANSDSASFEWDEDATDATVTVLDLWGATTATPGGAAVAGGCFPLGNGLTRVWIHAPYSGGRVQLYANSSINGGVYQNVRVMDGYLTLTEIAALPRA